jgi:expansin (peptidoglycan-binding protein)
MGRWPLFVLLPALASCSADGNGDDDDATTDTTPETTKLGEKHAGQYNLSPVAFSGSFWNSCAPYTPELESEVGTMLAGLALKWNGNGSLCDACVRVTTATGKSVTARVVTTGATHGPNDLDLSQSAFDAIDEGQYPRSMNWELVECEAGGKLQYQFQTEASASWTSLWVRNARLPVTLLEVKSQAHSDFTPLTRGGDGTLTDEAGFGDGSFTLRVTAIDGQVISDTIPAIVPGGVVSSSAQFQ